LRVLLKQIWFYCLFLFLPFILELCSVFFFSILPDSAILLGLGALWNFYHKYVTSLACESSSFYLGLGLAEIDSDVVSGGDIFIGIINIMYFFYTISQFDLHGRWKKMRENKYVQSLKLRRGVSYRIWDLEHEFSDYWLLSSLSYFSSYFLFSNLIFYIEPNCLIIAIGISVDIYSINSLA